MAERILTLTDKQFAVIIEALGVAADDKEDIDDPRHYTKEDLHNIAADASGMRGLADWLLGAAEAPGPCVECGAPCYFPDGGVGGAICSNTECMQHPPRTRQWQVEINVEHTVTAGTEEDAIRTAFSELIAMGVDGLRSYCHVDANEDEEDE